MCIKMDKIRWCLKQNKGIGLVEPNENLRRAYLKKAEEALETMSTTQSKDWQLTTAYYTIYHGIYSLLMKIGIKCEIHSCTIEFARRFLKKHFSAEDLDLIDRAFDARKDAQHYVDRNIPIEKYLFIISKSPSFLVKCKNIIMEEKEIIEIREKIKSKKKQNENRFFSKLLEIFFIYF